MRAGNAALGTIRDREFHDSSFDQHFPRRCRASAEPFFLPAGNYPYPGS